MSKGSFESQLLQSFNEEENEERLLTQKQMEEELEKRDKMLKERWATKYNKKWYSHKKTKNKMAKKSRKANR